MPGRFDYFIVIAAMRTGSNFLEECLNASEGLTCHGEAFNPYFMGHKGKTSLLGVTLEQRDELPDRLLAAMRGQTEGLPGFRFFHDHDPRILSAALKDPRCAKVFLSRAPLDSYVSLKIARKTDQCKLTNAKRRKSAKIHFDPVEFEAFRAELDTFYGAARRSLQLSGQTAFSIGYDQIGDLEVLNGLIAWLEGGPPLDRIKASLIKQNPAALEDKVENFDEMQEFLGASADNTAPISGPRRGAMVRDYMAAATAPVLFQPIPGGPTAQVEDWLAALDGVPPETGFTQKTLRQWMRGHKPHCRFTVVTNPLARAHDVFCDKILLTGPGSFTEIRGKLGAVYGVDLPGEGEEGGFDAKAHRHAFEGFLAFLQQNLDGQTNIRIDPHWTPQHAILRGFSEVSPPDQVLRAETLQQGLNGIAAGLGLDSPALARAPQTAPVALRDIYDGKLEQMARKVFQRDYVMFGIPGWTPTG